MKTLNVGDKVYFNHHDWGNLAGIVKEVQFIETPLYSFIHTRELVKPFPKYQRAYVEVITSVSGMPLRHVEARSEYFTKV